MGLELLGYAASILSIREIVSRADTNAHGEYLRRIGFVRREDGRWGLAVA